jgi:hypothetical protein
MNSYEPSPFESPYTLESPSLELSPIPDLETSIPLPPEAIYSTKEELFTSIQTWAAQNNYAFYIGRSSKLNNNRAKIIYYCDRYSSTPPLGELRQRDTASKKTGCQFSIYAIQFDSYWQLRYRSGLVYSTYNHPPSQSKSSHSSYRRLLKIELEHVRSLFNLGI